MVSAHYHLARAISRRTERGIWECLADVEEKGDVSVAKFVNRLSDYLFTCARYSCMLLKENEVLYKAPQ